MAYRIRIRTTRRRAGAIGVFVALMGAVALTAQSPASRGRFVVSHDWAGRGDWIAADTHVHSRFSDGSNTIADLVEKGSTYGCTALGITDHADRSLKGASPEYDAAMRQARATHPDRILLSGIEWNVPPFGGAEHASILMPSGDEGVRVLAEFKERFDDYERSASLPPLRADDALRWLAESIKDFPLKPVLVYNHPSRKRDSSATAVVDLAGWIAQHKLFVAFEGGVGHQQAKPLGSYGEKEPLIDRWDPAVARIGDTWDQLLQRGLDMHGAVTTSDFHNAQANDLNDFWPCQFSETWYYVPERSPAGLLRALRAGTFFGVHGRVARSVEITVTAPGLPRAAIAGETIEATAGIMLDVAVSFEVPRSGWDGQPNQIDSVDVIAVTGAGATSTTHQVSTAGGTTGRVTQSVRLGSDGLVVRARGRRVVSEGPDLLFYTNAIRAKAVR